MGQYNPEFIQCPVCDGIIVVMKGGKLSQCQCPPKRPDIEAQIEDWTCGMCQQTIQVMKGQTPICPMCDIQKAFEPKEEHMTFRQWVYHYRREIISSFVGFVVGGLGLLFLWWVL
jgi:hypothetical protein